MTIEKLPPMQARFAEEYPIDLNGLQAAVRAGYSPKTAQEQASRLLSKVMVQKAIQTALTERSKRTGLKADDVVKGFAAIAFTDLRDVLDWTGESVTLKEMDDISDNAHAAIAELTQVTNKDGDTTIRVKMHSKPAALDSLGKHLPGFFSSTTKHEVEVSGTVHHDDLKKYSLAELDMMLDEFDRRKALEDPAHISDGTEPAAPESLPEPGIVDANYTEISSEPEPTKARILDAPQSAPVDATPVEVPFDVTAHPYKPPSQF